LDIKISLGGWSELKGGDLSPPFLLIIKTLLYKQNIHCNTKQTQLKENLIQINNASYILKPALFKQKNCHTFSD